MPIYQQPRSTLISIFNIWQKSTTAPIPEPKQENKGIQRMASIKLVTFDLDNTLWNVDKVIVRAETKMRNWMKEYAPESLAFYSSDHLAEIRHGILIKHPAKRFDLSFMRLAILQKVMSLGGLDEKTAKQKADEAFEVFFEARNQVDFFSGAIGLLEELQDKYLLYALTNGNADIEKTGLSAYMKGAFSAADVAASKPSPKMFNRVLKQTQLKPENSVHVGDNLVDDIEGAANAGFFSIWVNLKSEKAHDDQAMPTQTVTKLSEIPAALDFINNHC